MEKVIFEELPLLKWITHYNIHTKKYKFPPATEIIHGLTYTKDFIEYNYIASAIFVSTL